ncbi:MAG TPA: YqgE/AlgH family protein, partial [Chitinophagaceae bacterium]|nr:YqgE/AlgH family protein [Chitinophagaceae bacterium]
CILISEPTMQDNSFSRTEVYMCFHDAKESVGFIQNRKANETLDQLVQHLSAPVFPVFIGGPVGLDSLHMIHSVPELIGGDEVKDGIYWGGDIESAFEHILLGRIHTGNCKFFIGYSGWGEGQLDAELDMHAWLVSEANKNLLFATNPETQWHQAIGALGKRFSPLLNIPLRPELN